MAVDAAPVQGAMFFRPWVRLVVRGALALLAMWVLHLAQGRYEALLKDYSNTFGFSGTLWLAFVGTAAGAGLLFGLAALFPFSRVRYVWSRLLLAALALLPLAQFWLVYGYLLPRRHSVGGWLARTTGWFGGSGIQFALAALVGVAVASGFRAAHDGGSEYGAKQSEPAIGVG